MRDIQARSPGVRGRGGTAAERYSARETLAEAAERLGGVERLVAWALADPDNEAAFWKTLYPKLLSLQVSTELGLSVEAQEWLGRAPNS